MRHIGDDERRARLSRRHRLSPAHRGGDVLAAAGSVGFLHATEPANVYLSLVARADVERADIDRVLFEDRALIRQLAMRRTVFAFPRELFPAVRGSVAARVATQLAARLAKEVQACGLSDDGAAWVARACDEVRAAVAVEPLTTAALRERIPRLAERIEIAPGKSYGGDFPVAGRVLSVLAADGSVVRGRNAAGWKVSRPYWTSVDHWLGSDPGALDEQAGYVEVIRAWLARFGPGTEDDIVWWLGATRTAVRRALAELDPVQVELDSGDTGWVLPDDVDAAESVQPYAALLPVLDPTTMGWQRRDFYLGPHAATLVDRGNAGATAWVGGRIVGTWVQDQEGRVVVLPLEDLPDEARAGLAAQARRLTDWLDGEMVRSVYAAPHARAWLAAPEATRSAVGSFPEIR